MAGVLLSWWRFLPVAARSGHSKNSTFMSRTLRNLSSRHQA
jgi:hypothetical protein